MKSTYIFIASIMLSFALQAQAGGHYTCEAKSGNSVSTIYIALDFQTFNNVTGYTSHPFYWATPTQPSLDYDHATTYYWTTEENLLRFQVLAILERDDVQNDAFRAKLSITDGRGMPYGMIYNLKCSK